MRPYYFFLSISMIISTSNCHQASSLTNDAALIQAYIATDYQVYPTTNDTLHIRINQHNKALDKFLQGHQSWAYITAWNPNSKPLPIAENIQRNQSFVATLKKQDLIYYLGKGIPDQGDWIPEESFLIVDLSKEAALKLGQTYGQKAIIWGQVDAKANLLFCMPK